jgi:hypothetical protein
MNGVEFSKLINFLPRLESLRACFPPNCTRPMSSIQEIGGFIEQSLASTRGQDRKSLRRLANVAK